MTTAKEALETAAEADTLAGIIRGEHGPEHAWALSVSEYAETIRALVEQLAALTHAVQGVQESGDDIEAHTEDAGNALSGINDAISGSDDALAAHVDEAVDAETRGCVKDALANRLGSRLYLRKQERKTDV